jgi:hypothetical protein
MSLNGARRRAVVAADHVPFYSKIHVVAGNSLGDLMLGTVV